MWARIDVNGNGYVSLAEITKVLQQLHNYHHTKLKKILMTLESLPPNGKSNEKFPYFFVCVP